MAYAIQRETIIKMTKRMNDGDTTGESTRRTPAYDDGNERVEENR